jgi:hypothetical protein
MSEQPSFKPPPFFRPTEVELWNPVATFRQTKAGNVHRVSFEVSAELWELFREPDSGLRLRGPLWRADDDESDSRAMQEAIDKPEAKAKKEAKPKEPKLSGPYGKFWARLIGTPNLNFFAQPGLRAILDTLEGESDKERLRRAFNVQSRAEISPERLKAWLREQGAARNLPIDGAVMIVEQVERELL